jgi:hypothetical protein
MALTLVELQAKRDKILRDIDLASVTFADGRSQSFITDKQKVLAILDEQIGTLSTTARLRRTTIRTEKGW